MKKVLKVFLLFLTSLSISFASSLNSTNAKPIDKKILKLIVLKLLLMDKKINTLDEKLNKFIFLYGAKGQTVSNSRLDAKVLENLLSSYAKKEDLEALKEKVDNLEKRQNETDKKLSSLEERIEKITKDLNAKGEKYYFILDSKGSLGVLRKDAAMKIFADAVKNKLHLVALKIYKKGISLDKVKRDYKLVKYCYNKFAFFRDKNHTSELSCYMSVDNLSKVKVYADWGNVLPKW